MPGALKAGYELGNVALAANEKMCRHPLRGDACEIGMRLRIKLIGEELVDCPPAKLSRRQADGVNNYQTGRFACGPRIAIRAAAPIDTRQPTSGIKLPARLTWASHSIPDVPCDNAANGT